MLQLKTEEVLDKQVAFFERGLAVPFILRPFDCFNNLILEFLLRLFCAHFCVKGFLHSKKEVMHDSHR